MSRLTPVSRASLRQYKFDEDERKRIQRIDEIVKFIYENVVATAKANTSTSFTFEYNYFGDQTAFVTANYEEIMKRLRSLFPDCSVNYKKSLYRKDGSTVDITNAPEQLLDPDDLKRAQECIVIDWS